MILREFRIGLAAWLPAVVCAIALPSAAVAASGTSSAWVMGDFNGDRKVDFAVVGAHGRQLHVELGSQQDRAFRIPSISANRLAMRDLDGDSDNDIVLETTFRQPIAVWINDGAGNFEEGSVDSFYFQLSHGDRQSLESPQIASLPLEAVECQSRDAVSSAEPGFNATCPVLMLRASGPKRAPPVYTHVTRTRGPPSNS